MDSAVIVPIEEQATAVEVSVANLQGHIENLELLVARNKRPAAELEIFAARLPALQAAAKTLRWMVIKEADIRKAVA